MLLNLNIKNYALIDELGLEFSEGLNIFTGETGAGKSIIIESLGLILGERASADVVRKGAPRCSITAEFDTANLSGAEKYLASLGFENEGQLIIRREIDPAGKSRAFINDRPSSAETLKNLGEFLVDVHGQHEHQALFKTRLQLNLLDSFAENEQLLSEIESKYQDYRKLLALKDARQMSEQERERFIELYTFQLKEIEAARLSEGEEEKIEQALPRLKNADKLMSTSEQAFGLLYSSEGSAIENLGKAVKLLENINSSVEDLAQTSENMNKAYYLLEECSRELEAFKDGLRADPEELNRLLERQSLIAKLKKKYGQSVAEIIAYREKISAELEALSRHEQDKLELDSKLSKSLGLLESKCALLSAERGKAAKKLSSGVEKELSDLGMKKASFKIKISKRGEPSSNGWDDIEFLFSANPGEEIKPLKDIASGGEISRVMLAIKTVLAKADSIPVMVFDEIDSGIGGPMGQTIGRKLSQLSKHHQVLCITHLPQIAAFAKIHMSVSKQTVKNITKTSVVRLSAEDSVEEISRMLSGHEITPAARKHAAELIENALK
ncbi:MAG TPA: DNA repair protein RecN [Elusimicrobia bacterium]|nr:MAG: DNA repair protein RecN [Elusimicrobia bacterium RIFOXYA12_FULL_49_49]OGS09826.1 MAG: DNA repair protein RecN [Elusimicrobia bacterium RIFOXYB1_FULL_48_9]OGS16351.1 MAG: DNA repair protein RecN [Elusimicrobia bacterium RIFOXYA2_FULL_47_53]OGS27268.1 MAG: DNA repair protein RecN [Elusimicrobia bacterium RIFOXYB12_FULL_50_12]OGS30471.1 MAG: DNA repair protein RecN [Elusimicrobia bacterium RIFOXYB2_FULL_46_23]HBU69462.1 DNA repair protein RecN [Elusimicrobiota bacterium]